MSDFKLRVGDLTIQFRAADGVTAFTCGRDHRSFITSEGKPDCVVDVHYGPIPKIDLGTEVFHSGGTWRLHKRDGLNLVPVRSPTFGPEPYRLAVFDDSFHTGDLYVDDSPSPYGGWTQGTPDPNGRGYIVDPLDYPMDEVLVVNLLAREGGINIHACGVDLDGWGLAFTGTSGTGKSTTARIWQKRGVTILSDDRLILRRKQQGYWVYGTPWHGEAALSCARGVPLERLYFLVQARENCARPISQSEAAARLLVRCFPTFYDSKGMESTLRTIGDVCRTVPTYELGFVPNESLLVYLDGLHAAALTAGRH